MLFARSSLIYVTQAENVTTSQQDIKSICKIGKILTANSILAKGSQIGAGITVNNSILKTKFHLSLLLPSLASSSLSSQGTVTLVSLGVNTAPIKYRLYYIVYHYDNIISEYIYFCTSEIDRFVFIFRDNLYIYR